MEIDLNKDKNELKYYYSENGETLGPFTLTQLLEKIEADTLVYREGIDWTNAREVEELRKFFSLKKDKSTDKSVVKVPSTKKPNPLLQYGLESSEQSSLNLVYMLNPDTKDGFKIFGDSDERFKISGGNSLLTEKMYEKLKDSIKLNFELSSIVEVNGKYKLTFSNNETSEYDYVILAIPFTVLRKVELKVTLPEDKIRAINELGYGTTSKIIFGVNERVWRENGYSGYLFSKEVQNGWDSSMGQNNNSGKGSYTVFLGGDLGKAINEDSTEGYIQKFNQIFSSKKEVINKKKLVFNWSSYPYSLGGYSAYKVGQWSTIAGQEKEPVNNLFFAGEHCSEDFQGYMNGGAETGRLAAESVIKRLQEKSSSKQKTV